MKLYQRVASCITGSCILLMSAALPAGSVFAVTDSSGNEITMTAVVKLNGTSATAEGKNVTVDGNKITISASGDYEISGTLDDGQIIVNVPDETADPGTVKLYFNGVNITGVRDAALLIENAENTSINLVEGTENYLYDGQTYSATTAVVYAKDDITIKGEGKLRIEATYQQGLHCNNDVKITGGTIKVKTEAADAIRGKTSVEVKGGVIDINSGGDGIKSTKGDVLISGGTIDIKASNDAVQGETSLQIEGGILKANGDRSLTNAAGVVKITGGTILATATDNQIASIDSTQNLVTFQTTAEQVKDQIIALTSGEDTVFEMVPDKKFDFVMISSPELKTGSEYTLLIGEKECAVFTVSETVTALDPVTVPADAVVINYDVDCNGTEDVRDAVLLARIISEDTSMELTDEILERSDVNGDGKYNLSDLTMVLRFLAGLD
ncbi:MAG: carbohydrate-binding domain-containing protein [Oscillospiraceae bacterium]|nr:carbohydrate-binding domain-containing protein [Oscillospiraceae bacterium]